MCNFPVNNVFFSPLSPRTLICCGRRVITMQFGVNVATCCEWLGRAFWCACITHTPLHYPFAPHTCVNLRLHLPSFQCWECSQANERTTRKISYSEYRLLLTQLNIHFCHVSRVEINAFCLNGLNGIQRGWKKKSSLVCLFIRDIVKIKNWTKW